MKRLIQYLFFCFLLVYFTSCKEKKASLPEAFLSALNNYKKDSLRSITSDHFELIEPYVSHSFNKAEFLDSFVTFSKVINGKFRIIKTILLSDPAVFLVEDVSDLITYLHVTPLTWKITINTKDGKVEQMISDTTTGYQRFLDAFIPKYDDFVSWLNSKYPGETQINLYHDTTGLFAGRLKEYHSSQPTPESEIKKLLFTAQIGQWERSNNRNYLSVTTTLQNSSPDTVNYLSMSCSWQDCYTTDTKDLTVAGSVCNKNIPKLVKIPPHGKDERILKLATPYNSGQPHEIKFRIGFNFMPVNDYEEVFYKIKDLREMKNMIWSDTLQVR